MSRTVFQQKKIKNKMKKSSDELIINNLFKSSNVSNKKI